MQEKERKHQNKLSPKIFFPSFSPLSAVAISLMDAKASASEEEENQARGVKEKEEKRQGNYTNTYCTNGSKSYVSPSLSIHIFLSFYDIPNAPQTRGKKGRRARQNIHAIFISQMLFLTIKVRGDH